TISCGHPPGGPGPPRSRPEPGGPACPDVRALPNDQLGRGVEALELLPELLGLGVTQLVEDRDRPPPRLPGCLGVARVDGGVAEVAERLGLAVPVALLAEHRQRLRVAVDRLVQVADL